MSVKTDRSTPSADSALAEASMEAGMDGKKVPVSEALLWQASEPMYETHFQVRSAFLVPAQMLLPLELLITARVVPSGPYGGAAMPAFTPGIFTKVEASQEPPISMATLWEESRSTS